MPTDDDWPALTAAIATHLQPHGFDIVHSFAVAWFNDAVEPAQRLPDLGRADALGVLVGNTRAIWPPFVATCRSDAAMRDAADPVERYVETRVTPVIAALGVRSAVRWAHDPPPRLAIQRLADVTGLAPLSPVGLNVHPIYGPWFALRAALVLDVAGPPGEAPRPPLPCPDCARTCQPSFDRAMAAQRTRTGISETWPLWLAVRESCPIGREWRYDEAQIRYHYARDRSVLA